MDRIAAIFHSVLIGVSFSMSVQPKIGGPRWQSGNTLASHLCSQGSIPVMAVSGKAGSCLPLVGSLHHRTLANYMYWFPLPFQLPVVIWPYSVESDVKPQINKQTQNWTKSEYCIQNRGSLIWDTSEVPPS